MLSPYMSPVERAWYYSLRLLCGLVLLFLVLPILVIVPLSFNSGTFLIYPMQGFSMRWYEDFFGSAGWMRALKNSMIIAPAATVLAMIMLFFSARIQPAEPKKSSYQRIENPCMG